MADPFTIISLVATVGGTILSTVGQIQQARAQQNAAAAALAAGQFQRRVSESQARALERRAGEERAVSQRELLEERRQGRFVRSRALALGAASGAGVSDPGFVGLLGDLDTETEIRAQNALFGGETAARNLEFGAGIERAGGDASMIAAQAKSDALRAGARQSFFGAAGTLLSGGASLYDKYRDLDQGAIS